MRQWTREQQDAIGTTDRNVLVSAGAGSGKTEVLKERIVRLVKAGVPITKLLVVTFTRAAAAEMTQRIRRGLLDAMEEEQADTPWLRSQLDLISQANISTIHAFCANVLRRRFDLIGADPAFRVASETESRILLLETARELLEEWYDQEDGEILSLTEWFGSSDDEQLMDMILRVREFSMSTPNPYEWLENASALYFNGSYIKGVVQLGAAKTAEAKELMEKALCLLGGDGYEPERCVLRQELFELERYENELASGEALPPVWGRLFWRTKPAHANMETIKSLRDEAKDTMGGVLRLFPVPLQEIEQRTIKTGEMVSVLCRTAIRLDERYGQKKRDKNVMDYNDLEHFALKIFELEPKEWQEKFAYIFVDEYQDSSRVQEEIINRIKRENNVFLVGDVKQSIYRFRLAEPELFLDKFNAYSEEKGTEPNYKIRLNANFRSKQSILNYVNSVFTCCMSKETGDVDYDGGQCLQIGDNEKQTGGDTCLVKLLDREKGASARDVALSEAAVIACRMKELHKLGYRYGDMAVLLRSIKENGSLFAAALTNEGIPVFEDYGAELLKTPEIEAVVSVLQTMDNSRQDVMLLAAMRSFMGGFNDRELAQIRAENGMADKDTAFYDAVMAAGQRGDGLGEKVRAFFRLIETYRRLSQRRSIEELIEALLYETGYYDYVLALSGGDKRRGNLELLLQAAKEYAAGEFKGLWGFLRYFEELKGAGGGKESAANLGVNDDVVRITTIHKSKGLQFPCVFIPMLGAQFNTSDQKEPVLLHKRLGVGLEYRNTGTRQRSEGAARLLMKETMAREETSEQMRILYVAMTRAKEQLMLVGSHEDAAGYAGAEEWKTAGAKRFLDWIVPASLHNPACDFQIMEAAQPPAGSQEQYEMTAGDDTFARERFAWRYPYDTSAPSKMSVSELTAKKEGAPLRTEAAVPQFIKTKAATAGQKGSVWHFVLQHIDLGRTTLSDVENQLSFMVEKELLLIEEASLVDPLMIARFFETGVGLRIRNAKKVWREWPFNLRINAHEAGFGEGELLLQGIIDCVFMEEDGVYLVDYKTDRLQEGKENEFIQRHSPQLDLYEKALCGAQLTVRGKCLYSFALHREFWL
ncbi:MAG: helicase-exonuclease AddAB subunit AddA [Christensenellales bacterium]